MADAKLIGTIDSAIRELEAELEALPTFRQLQVLRKTKADLMAINGVRALPNEIATPAKRRRFGQPKGTVSILEAVVKAIGEAGHPLTTNQLLERIGTYGAQVGGQNKQGNITSIISKRADTLVTVKGWHGNRSTWWFKDRPVPHANSLV